MSFYGKIVNDTSLSLGDLKKWIKIQKKHKTNDDEDLKIAEDEIAYIICLTDGNNDYFFETDEKIIVPHDRISKLEIDGNQIFYDKKYLDSNGEEKTERDSLILNIPMGALSPEVQNKINQNLKTDYDESTKTLSIILGDGTIHLDSAWGVGF